MLFCDILVFIAAFGQEVSQITLRFRISPEMDIMDEKHEIQFQHDS